jgi:hypothetical protein
MPIRAVHKAPCGHCLGPARSGGARASGVYSRLFPHLEALAVDPDLIAALGQREAACDGGLEGPESDVAAGWPFFGQLIAHDITADRSPLDHARRGDLVNFRAPRLNLECLYGAGPTGSPYLFDRADPAKFLLGAHDGDLPRNAQGTALIGDPRDDSHLVVSQMHLALLRAHNRIVDRLRLAGTAEDQLFAEARRLLTWHYQWVVVNDFLAGLIEPGLLAAALSGEVTLPLPNGASIPVEFADAAYRYGHSQIRQSYRINATSDPLLIFPDLTGFRPVPPERVIDFTLFFDIPGQRTAQRALRIDARLPRVLIELPEDITGRLDDRRFGSLAARDMQRGVSTGLPSGEAVARAFGLEPLSPEEIGLSDWPGETPLWYYVAREAAVLGGGDRLGPVGGRLVAGVLVALLDRDPESYRRQAPDWAPTLPARGGDPRSFGLLDLLLAGC